MAKLPSRDTIARVGQFTTGLRTGTPDFSGLSRAQAQEGEAFENLGRAAVKIGGQVQAAEEQKMDAGVEMAYQEFDHLERTTLDEQTRNMEPGQAEAFADNWRTGYMDRAKDFMQKRVPAHRTDVYTKKLFNTERDLYGTATKFERSEQSRVANRNISIVGDRVAASAASAPTNELDSKVATFVEALDKDTTLTPIEKDQKLQEETRKIAIAHFNGIEGEAKKVLVERIRAHRAGEKDNDKLVEFESGGDPSAFNNLGFAGKYQVGAPRLDHLKVYKRGANENLQTWNTTYVTDQTKWSGEFNIPGHKDVKTIGDFLANPEAQETVQKLHFKEIDEFIKKHKLNEFIGKTVGGHVITRNSMRYMAHLGGNGGMKKFLETGGRSNPADANGTRLSTYAKLGAAKETGGPAAVFASLSDSDLEKLEDQAERETAAQTRKAEKQRATTAAKEVDKLQFDIRDGKAGPKEIDEARKNGLFKNFEEYDRVRKQLEKQNEENILLDRFNKVLLGKGVLDPKDKDDKKMLNTYFGREIQRERIAGGDPAAADELVRLVGSVEAVPEDARNLLGSMLDSRDDAKTLYAYQTLNRIRMQNPDVFDRMPDSITRRVEKFGTQGEFTEEKKLLEQLREKVDPVTEAVQKTRRSQAEKDTKDMTADGLISDLDLDTLFEFSDPAVAVGPGQTPDGVKGALLREYRNLYAEEFARGENADDAAKYAKKQLMRVWGRSDVTGAPRLMKHAPENYYKSVDGSFDWMKEQLETDVRAKLFPNVSGATEGLFGTIFSKEELPEMSLVPAPGFDKEKPSWQVVLVKDGLIDVIRKKDGSPLLYSFDIKPVLEEKERKEKKNRAAAIKREQEAEFQSIKDGGRVVK